MRRARRLLALTGLAVVLTTLTATPAMAHGRGSDATNFDSVILDHPRLDGIAFEVVNADEFLLLTNTSGSEVMIPGYEGEPYLRVGPDGVFRNRNSRATYLNEERFGDVAIPANADASAEPDWEQLSSRDAYAWHDHRIHWMALADPPAVRTAPDEVHVVNTWVVPFEVDGTTHELAGELRWIPGGSPFVWLLPALLVVSIPIAVALARTRPDVEAGVWPGLARPAGVVLLVIATANLFHLVDDLVATPIPLAESLVTAVQTAFFIAIAVFGGVRTIQGREGAFTALGVGAGAVFIGQGLLYIGVLGASQTASLFPGWLTRAIIAASVVQVLPLGLAAVVGTRSLLPEFDDDADDLLAEAQAQGDQARTGGTSPPVR